MSNENDKTFIDAEYTNTEDDNNINKKESKDRTISGNPIFYTTTQTAKVVGVEPSTIRFWSKRFADLLDVEISNKNKQFKKSDIEKLKFIKKLTKEDGLTLKQVENYCSSKDFDINNIEKNVLDSNNPIAIQTFISAMTVEMDKKLINFSEDLLSKIDEKLKGYSISQNDLNEKIREDTITTIDEVVSERVENKLNNFNKNLDTNLNSKIDTIKSEIALDSENKSKQAKEIIDKIDKFNELTKSTDENQVEMMKKLTTLLDTTSRMEKHKEDKEYSFWNKVKNVFKNKDSKDIDK